MWLRLYYAFAAACLLLHSALAFRSAPSQQLRALSRKNLAHQCVPAAQHVYWLSRRQTISCRWIDESVSLEIPVSKEEAYGLYSQLDQHTRWSPWLNDVTYDKDQGVSTWVLRVLGLRISWESINTVEEPPREIAWESRTGLQNRGRVTFVDDGSEPNKCIMDLTLSYNIPRAIAAVLRTKGNTGSDRSNHCASIGRNWKSSSSGAATAPAAALAAASAANDAVNAAASAAATTASASQVHGHPACAHVKNATALAFSHESVHSSLRHIACPLQHVNRSGATFAHSLSLPEWYNSDI
eukprot:9917-Heterococcus_DN1.PRE.5